MKFGLIKFGSRVEPMVDKYLIEDMHGLSFIPNRPVEHEKVLGFDTCWENPGSQANTILKDESVIRLCYRGWPEIKDLNMKQCDNDDQTTCFALSNDGIVFERPVYNLVEWEGSKENNIVLRNADSHNFCAFYDNNPDCPPEHKYKAICGLCFTGGLYAYSSPDCIHWSRLSETPVMTDGIFDSPNMAFYDSVAGLYRCYYRYWTGNYDRYWDGLGGYRGIESCVSTDFIHWSKPVPNYYVELPEQTEHLYTNATRPIPGAEHILVSMPMRFHETRKKLKEYNGNPWNSNGLSDVLLMTSRDGHNWNRTIKEPYIRNSLDPSDWTQRGIIPLGGIIDRNGEFYIYCAKHYMSENDGIWRYSIPRFRFISVSAPYDGGEFTTKLVEFTSDDIYLNYQTGVYGYIVVDVLDETGNVIHTGEEIFGNELSCHIHFEGIKGTCGRLRFRMKESELYAIGCDMSPTK